jgi:hypothetical protein
MALVMRESPDQTSDREAIGILNFSLIAVASAAQLLRPRAALQVQGFCALTTPVMRISPKRGAPSLVREHPPVHQAKR